MNIAMTYDLRQEYLDMGFSKQETAEFDSPVTIAAIENVLRNMGHDVVHVGHAKALVERLARGERWDMVFNIAEGMHGEGRESLVPALLDAYGIPYTFSGPGVLALCLDKGATKAVVRAAGVPTPDYALLRSMSAAEKLPMSPEGRPLFLKPVAEGTGKGITPHSLVRTREELLRSCRELLETHRQPVLAETYLPGREFTVGIVGQGEGSRVLGVLEVRLNGMADQAGYTYENKQSYLDRVTYSLVSDPEALKAGEVALHAWKVLGCLDAGRVDLRSDEHGMPQFMEVNPLAGLHPVDSDLPILCRLAGVSYRELIAGVVESATFRAYATESCGPAATAARCVAANV